MNRIASFLLLLGAIVFNSEARAIELECGAKAVVAGSWRLSPSATASSELNCQRKCNFEYGPKDFLTGDRRETVTCKPSVLNCSPKNTGVKEVEVTARFTPPRGGPAHTEEPTPQRPLGECNCSAELKLEVECEPGADVPPPSSFPFEQTTDPVTCCGFYRKPLPPPASQPGFLDRLGAGALIIEAVTRDQLLIAAICSDGREVYGPYPMSFESGMNANQFRILWYHRSGFTAGLGRGGLEPWEGLDGFYVGGCFQF